MARIRVGLIFGGRSGEHEVSLVSAQSVMSAIDPTRYEVVPIGITKEGQWLTGGDPMRQLAAEARLLLPSLPTNGPMDATAAQTLAVPNLVRRDQATANGVTASHSMVEAKRGTTEGLLPVDVVFPVLHGPYGEDGTVQGLLELMNIPYVGANVAASAVGMDKAFMKALFQQAGLPIVEYVVVQWHRWECQRESVLDEIEQTLRYPVFTKPANLGSSVGISKTADRSQLARAIDYAGRYDRKILVEQGVDAREVEVGVLGNDEPAVSVPGEVLPHGEFYDYKAKYLDEGTRFIIPAELPSATVSELKSLAIRAFQAIDCAGMARVDFFVERGTDRVIVNEINTIPGFTHASVYPKLWEASGIPYAALIDRLIQLAIERHREKSGHLIAVDPDDVLRR